MTPEEYREKHRRCRTCTYCRRIYNSYDCRNYDNYCEVKNKNVCLDDKLIPAGTFCKLYKPKKFEEV